MGLCGCGCGLKAPLAKRNYNAKGIAKGQPLRYISGHNSGGHHNPRWKGGRKVSKGYVRVWVPDHPNADQQGRVCEHILVAERAMGKYLDRKHPVHHINEDKSDNRPENLVVCEDNAYHTLLHFRLKALRSCGNASYRRCKHCQQWDDPANLANYGKNKYVWVHRSCEAANARQRRMAYSKGGA